MVKPPDKLRRQMSLRGWTQAQIAEAVARGERHPAINVETGKLATRYIHPETGRSVVVEDVSGEVIHVGGDDFLY